MKKQVIKQFQRPSESLLQKFEGLPSALLHEAMGKRGALNHEVKSVFAGAVLLGTAFTVKSSPGDNLMLHLAISLAQPGDVLVAAVGGYTEGC